MLASRNFVLTYLVTSAVTLSDYSTIYYCTYFFLQAIYLYLFLFTGDLSVERPELDTNNSKLSPNFWTAPVPQLKDGEEAEDVGELMLQIVFRPDNQLKLRDKRTKKSYVWAKIVAELATYGVKFPSQCEEKEKIEKTKTKYNNIIATYNSFVRNANTTGASSSKEPRYYDFLHEKLSNSPKVKPQIIDSQLSLNSTSQDTEDPDPVSERFTVKKKRKSVSENICEVMKENKLLTASRMAEIRDFEERKLALYERELKIKEEEAVQRRELIELLKATLEKRPI